MPKLRWIALSLAFLAAYADAERVLSIDASRKKVKISQPETARTVGDHVCVSNADETLCGTVILATSTEAVLELDVEAQRVAPSGVARPRPPKRVAAPKRKRGAPARQAKKSAPAVPADERPFPEGDAAAPVAEPADAGRADSRPSAAEPPPRSEPVVALEPKTISVAPPSPPPPPPPPAPSRVTPAPVVASARLPANAPSGGEVSAVSKKKASVPGWHFGLGFGGGLNYFFPLIRAERRIGAKTSVALTPIYSFGGPSTARVSARGAFLTAAHYFGSTPLAGIFFEGGLGFYAINRSTALTSDDSTSLAVPLMGGWRTPPSFPLSITARAGVQSVNRMSGDGSRINFSGLLPLFMMELGHTF